MTGRVMRIIGGRRFGFLAVPGLPKSIFFHFSDCLGRPPEVGEVVTFREQSSARGPRAVAVRVVAEDAAAPTV